MKIQLRSLSQIHWIAIVLGMIVLFGGGWWMNEKLVPQLRPAMAEVSHPDPQNMKKMGGMDMKAMPGSSDREPAQASLMVSPLKQQMIGVQTMLVETRRLSTTVRAAGRSEEHTSELQSH